MDEDEGKILDFVSREYPILLTEEALRQDITRDIILRAYYDNPYTYSELRELRDRILKNIEISRIANYGIDPVSLMDKSLDDLREYSPYRSGIDSYSPPKNILSNLPTEVLGKIGAYTRGTSAMGTLSKSSFKKARLSRESPLYWKERVEIKLGFDMQRISNLGVDWKQVYRNILYTENFILSSDKNLFYSRKMQILLVLADKSEYTHKLFIKACYLGHIYLVELLLKLDTDIKENIFGGSCLQLACAKGHGEVAKLLLKAETLDFQVFKTKNLLSEAVKSGSFDCVKTIVEDHRYRFIWDDYSNIAAVNGYDAIFEFLWSMNEISRDGSSVFSAVCLQEKDIFSGVDNEDKKLNIIKLVALSANDIKYRDCIKEAANNGYSKILDYLILRSGIDIRQMHNDIFINATNIPVEAHASYNGERGSYINAFSDSHPYGAGKKKIIFKYIEFISQEDIQLAYESAVEYGMQFMEYILEPFI